MTTYTYRAWVLPNPDRKFLPQSEIWQDVELDASHTLAAFHEALSDGFDRPTDADYEFVTIGPEGISEQRYVPPERHDGGPSWEPLDDDEVEQTLEQAVDDDAPASARERFREVRTDPPPLGDAAATTLEELDPGSLNGLQYVVDPGDGEWTHFVKLRETDEEGSVDGDPTLGDDQGDAPGLDYDPPGSAFGGGPGVGGGPGPSDGPGPGGPNSGGQ